MMVLLVLLISDEGTPLSLKYRFHQLTDQIDLWWTDGETDIINTINCCEFPVASETQLNYQSLNMENTIIMS